MLLNAWAINGIVLNGPSASGSEIAEDLSLLLSGAGYAVFARVRIADANSEMREYSSRSNINWIHSLEWGGDIDAPVANATVRLLRSAGRKNLAPLDESSSYNADGPSVDAGRRLQIDTAVVPLGTLPSAVDDDAWQMVFDGYIDKVNWQANPLEVTARDLGSVLMDAWYAGRSTFIDEEGQPLEDVMQWALDGLALEQAVLLYVPMAYTGAQVKTFAYDIEAGFDALIRLAQVAGWDLRYRWSEAHQAFVLTFQDPGRDKVTPDYTFSAAHYIDVTNLAIDRLPIRNDITIQFPDSGAAGATAAVRHHNPTSVQRYGRRSMVIQEETSSPIDTTAEAERLIDLILADIADPKAEQAVDMPYFPLVELHDLIRWEANGVHYSLAQDWAVVSYRHTLSDTESRTRLMTRGSPAGSWWQWLRRKGGIEPVEPTTPPSPPGFSALAQVGDDATDTIALNWTWVSTEFPSATFKIYVRFKRPDDIGAVFVLDGTESASPHSYAPGVDLDNFGEGELEISFYVEAWDGGVKRHTSIVNVATYFTAP